MSTAAERPAPDRAPDERGDEPAGPPDRSGRGELVMAGLLAALGAYLIVDAGSITVPGSANTVGPRFFPYLVGGLVVATAVLLLVRVLRGDRAPADGSEDVDADAPTSWRALGVVALAFAAHALLINQIGWPLAVSLMFGTVAWALGAGSWLRAALVGGAVSVVAWIVFARLLDVALPGGVVLEFLTEWL